MKDCQTVKYDWLVKLGMIGRLTNVGELLDWLIKGAMIDLLGKEQREFARHMHMVQRTGMVVRCRKIDWLSWGSEHGRVASTGNTR